MTEQGTTLCQDPTQGGSSRLVIGHWDLVIAAIIRGPGRQRGQSVLPRLHARSLWREVVSRREIIIVLTAVT